MKKACLVVGPAYLKGEMFNPRNDFLNRDNCLAFFHLLQREMKLRGYDLNTQDINLPSHCDIVIYNEMPQTLPDPADTHKSFLLLFETELIQPSNWDLESHQRFSKIFTWDDNFVDNKKYFKMNLAQEAQVEFVPFKNKTKLCTLIAGNKSVSHPLELYSKRKEAIRWFEQNRPLDFEFYGMGWGVYTFQGPKVIRALNRVSFLRIMLAEKWPSYLGPVKKKLETLKNYKFSICYENAQNIPGYITEKIFDSIGAGCVPIYWGAPNISEYIPTSCFVDRRKFKSYEELYKYISEISESEYAHFQTEMKNYLHSLLHEQFTPAGAVRKVIENVVGMTP